ncbi:MAG TPA: Nif11-like leader peptide family natural product precursor [Leptolyngbyaceae cyanobacterium]
MSRDSAEKFLEAATEDSTLREKLKSANSLQDFIDVAETMGYSFTNHELKAVIKENSEGVTMRRKTGIWPWLRQFSWG